MVDKRILLICFSFPPFPGIGGRRWAKFAKYLAKEGWEVFVLCAKNTHKNQSEWLNDVSSPLIHIYEKDTGLPKQFMHTPESIWQKVIYHFWKHAMKVFSKGRIYDNAFFWKNNLINSSEQLIKEYNIKNVICTIPPYRLAYYVALIKNRNPTINYILDYRDAWTDNQTFYEFKDLSRKRRNYELFMEKFALKSADHVISCTEQMTLWAKNKSDNPDKCITVRNGFDEDDILHEEKAVVANHKIIFLFAGTLYLDLEYIFVPFLNAIKQMEQIDLNFSNNYCFKFYGNINPNLHQIIKEYSLKSVEVNGFIPIKEIRKEYVAADFFTMFSVQDHGFAFNTKFFEYLSYRKPILHFSGENSDVSSFLKKNKIGVGLTPSTIEQTMKEVVNLIDKGEFLFNRNFNSENFSIKNITKEIIPLLK